jgi:uncharacterized repeat protein (TIGR02543 family)
MKRIATILAACVLTIAFIACPQPTTKTEYVEVPVRDPDTYHVLYAAPDRTWGSIPVDKIDYDIGNTATVLGEGDLYRTGYTFAGWENGDALYKEGDKITLDGDLTLTATWNEVFPKVAAGDNFSLLLTEDGKVYSAGNTGNGRLGRPNSANQTWGLVDIPGKVTDLSTGISSSYALRDDGTVYAWGRSYWGGLGLNAPNEGGNYSSPQPVSNLTNINALSITYGNGAFIDAAGNYWAAGSRYYNNLGDGLNVNYKKGAIVPEQIKTFEGFTYPVKSAAAGYEYTALVDSDGLLWVGGRANNSRMGIGREGSLGMQINGYAGAGNRKVFVSKNSTENGNYTMVLKNDGTVRAAGSVNGNGKLGIGTTINTDIATNVFAVVMDGATYDPLTDVEDIALGADHSLFLKKDGSLWACGNNGSNRLGISGSNQTYAVQVADHVAHFAAGSNHTLIVKDDGTVYAAGANGDGQFGNGTTTGSNSSNPWVAVTLPE